MSTKEKKVLNRIREVARQAVPKNGQAILYGSRARGDAHPGSDWDILILIDKERVSPEDYATVSFPFVNLGWDINEEINPILYTHNEWKSYDFTPFYENVTHDGITL